MELRLYLLCCIFLIVSEVNGSNLVIERSYCFASQNEFCEEICTEFKSEEGTWRIHMDSKGGSELCSKPKYFELKKSLSLGQNVYYKIHVKENKKEFKLYYVHSEENVLWKTQKTNTEEDITLTDDQNEDDFENNFPPEDRKYFQNIKAFLQNISKTTTLFLYQLNTSTELPNESGSFLTKTNKLDLMNDFFAEFGENTFFEPAVRTITNEEAYNAWHQLEVQVINSMNQYTESFTILSGFVEDEKLKITYLLKQIVYSNKTIVFLIPDVSVDQYAQNLYQPCRMLGKRHEWYFQNLYTYSCDPRKIKEDWINTEILSRYRIDKRSVSDFTVPIRKDGYNIDLLWTTRSRTDKKVKGYCKNDSPIYINNQIVYSLLEISEDQTCHIPYDQQILEGASTVTGLVIESATSNLDNWNFFETKILLEGNVNSKPTWFIKLSESVPMSDNKGLGFKYYTRIESAKNLLYTNLLHLKSYDCDNINSTQVGTEEIFQWRHVFNSFNTLMQTHSDEEKKTYLQILWKHEYMSPIPYIYLPDMMFEGFGNTYSCAIIPMWTAIYQNYWHEVEKITQTLLIFNKVNANIYTLTYEPLKNSNGDIFYLYKNEDGSNKNVVVHEFIIRVIISPVGSIAFLTVNDVFRITKTESPFVKSSYFNDYCKLRCDRYGFGNLHKNSPQLTFCCKVNMKFLRVFTNEIKKLTNNEMQILTLKHSDQILENSISTYHSP